MDDDAKDDVVATKVWLPMGPGAGGGWGHQRATQGDGGTGGAGRAKRVTSGSEALHEAVDGLFRQALSRVDRRRPNPNEDRAIIEELRSETKCGRGPNDR